MIGEKLCHNHRDFGTAQRFMRPVFDVGAGIGQAAGVMGFQRSFSCR